MSRKRLVADVLGLLAKTRMTPRFSAMIQRVVSPGACLRATGWLNAGSCVNTAWVVIDGTAAGGGGGTGVTTPPLLLPPQAAVAMASMASIVERDRTDIRYLLY